MQEQSFIETLKFKWMSMPLLASEHGDDVDKFVVYIHALMLVLFIGWFGYFLLALWKFNARRNPKADHVGVRNHASTWLEVAVAVVEAVLLLGFAIPLWAKQVENFPGGQETVTTRVVAEQFTWNIRYPGKDNTFGRQDYRLLSQTNPMAYDPADAAGKDDVTAPVKDMHVPVGRDVVVHLSSKDVIHSFKVAPLRVCQDAIPGISIPLHFKATKPGRYLITCAQLCGNGHASMNGWLTVDTAADYEAWLAKNAAASAGGAPASFE